MHLERVQQLRNYIASLPSEQVFLQHYFSDADLKEDSLTGSYWCTGNKPVKQAECACICGHAIILFQLIHNGKSLCSTLSEFFDADEYVLSMLFCIRVKNKGKQAALSRLDHLLQHGSMHGYSYDSEIEEISP